MIIQKYVSEPHLIKLSCCTAVDICLTENRFWFQLGHQTCVIKHQNSVYRAALTQVTKGKRKKGRTAVQLGKLAERLPQLHYVRTCEKTLLSELPRLLNTACSQVLHEVWRAFI